MTTPTPPHQPEEDTTPDTAGPNPDAVRRDPTDNESDNPHSDTPGHPDARGTLPMAHYLTDLETEDEIQALAAEAPSLTPDLAARLARMLRLTRRPIID